MNGLKLLDESWDDLDLAVGDDWNETDLMPFEKQDIAMFTSYLQKIKELEALAEEREKAVLEFMRANNIKSLKSDYYTVTFTPDGTKSTLDKSKLFKEHPEIKETDYQKISPRKAFIKVVLK